MKPSNYASYLKIATVFDNSSERTLTNLARVYKDADRLQLLLRELISDSDMVKEIPGKRVMMKPNWVRHSVKEHDRLCLRTHDAFLIATLECILQLGPISVVVGDAPIQGCRWNNMLEPELLAHFETLRKKYGIPISVIDFRRTTFNSRVGQPVLREPQPNDHLIFDLGSRSLLEPITADSHNPFRVTLYNPDGLANRHKPGIHQYCLTNQVFDADVILSLPKVKTHQKTGITAALKNVVGMNVDKNFLPHHRIGGAGRGGDCYPGTSRLRYWSELAMDQANRNHGNPWFRIWRKASTILWRLSFPRVEHQFAAGWHGNDTCWRMVLDINHVIRFGTSDGCLADSPQRVIYSLCDGIIGGQGDGPLQPTPLPLGIVAFSNNSALCDVAMATLMGFDYKKLPLVRAAATIDSIVNADIQIDASLTSIADLRELAVPATPPPAWVTYLSDHSNKPPSRKAEARIKP